MTLSNEILPIKVDLPSRYVDGVKDETNLAMDPLSSILWQPIGELHTKNRFFKSAMSEGMADPNGAPNARLVRLYERWADGGVGISVTGHVMIDSRYAAEPHNVIVEDESHLDQLRDWAKAGTRNDCQLIMQINHPGRQIPFNMCQQPVAPSAIGLASKKVGTFFNTPRALETTEIRGIVKRFGNTAYIAAKAGFSGVQIHSAHGYLLSQFLSPLSNVRSDEYGGDIQNRMRILEEVYHEIRKRIAEFYAEGGSAVGRGTFSVGIKLNSADFQRGGFTSEDSMKVVERLCELGIDFIEISGGTYEAPALIHGSAVESWESVSSKGSGPKRNILKKGMCCDIPIRSAKRSSDPGSLESAGSSLGGVLEKRGKKDVEGDGGLEGIEARVGGAEGPNESPTLLSARSTYVETPPSSGRRDRQRGDDNEGVRQSPSTLRQPGVRQSTLEREAYFLDYALKVRSVVDEVNPRSQRATMLILTGGLRSELAMAHCISLGRMDMVGMARPFVLCVDLPNRILNGTYATVDVHPIKLGLNFLDKSVPILEIAWYEQQMDRIGRGGDPDPDLGSVTCLLNLGLTYGFQLFRGRRA